MAKFNLILGSLSGSVGDITVRQIEGQQVTSRRARRVKNPRTEKQVTQRTAIGSVSRLVRAFKPLYDLGYKSRKIGQTKWAACLEHNNETYYKDANDQLVKDLTKIKVGKGPLEKIHNLSGLGVTSGDVEFSWDTTTYIDGAVDDKIFAVVVNDNDSALSFIMPPVDRSEGISTYQVPAGFPAGTAHVAILVVTADFSKTSDTIYAGTVTV